MYMTYVITFSREISLQLYVNICIYAHTYTYKSSFSFPNNIWEYYVYHMRTVVSARNMTIMSIAE